MNFHSPEGTKTGVSTSLLRLAWRLASAYASHYPHGARMRREISSIIVQHVPYAGYDFGGVPLETTRTDSSLLDILRT